MLLRARVSRPPAAVISGALRSSLVSPRGHGRSGSRLMWLRDSAAYIHSMKKRHSTVRYVITNANIHIAPQAAFSWHCLPSASSAACARRVLHLCSAPTAALVDSTDESWLRATISSSGTVPRDGAPAAVLRWIHRRTPAARLPAASRRSPARSESRQKSSNGIGVPGISVRWRVAGACDRTRQISLVRAIAIPALRPGWGAGRSIELHPVVLRTDRSWFGAPVGERADCQCLDGQCRRPATP